MDRVPLKALLIEDVEDDALLLARELGRYGYDLDFRRVDTAAALEEALNPANEWQIIFSDYSMPAFDGLSALKQVRDHDEDIPFIFVSGTIGEEIAVRAVLSGAQDYILKDNLKRLSAAVPREIREAEVRRKQRAAEERIEYLANFDETTALPNRYQYQNRLSQLVDQAREQQELLGLFILRINRFNDVGNSLGARSNDLLVRAFADRLRQLARPGDIVARLDNDLFAVILPGRQDAQTLSDCASVLCQVTETPFVINGYALRLSACAGMSLFPQDADSSETLHGNASLAKQKRTREVGQGLSFFTAELRQLYEQRQHLEQELESALSDQQFSLYYQPQVRLSDMRLVGAEALIRWQHPAQGFIPPAHFIPVAEETGHILSIGNWVLETACQQVKHWEQATPGSTPRVAVNFSAYQFRQNDLVENIEALLQRLQLQPQQLEVEITETALMQDPETARSLLKRLRDLGISISLDDFGTGYSSLSYLKRFPVNVLKIDQSFVRDIPDDHDSLEITRAILAMTARLNIEVIAEGVETREQLEFLGNEGCDLVQGYLLSRPLPAAEFSQLLTAQSPFVLN